MEQNGQLVFSPNSYRLGMSLALWLSVLWQTTWCLKRIWWQLGQTVVLASVHEQTSMFSFKSAGSEGVEMKKINENEAVLKVFRLVREIKSQSLLRPNCWFPLDKKFCWTNRKGRRYY